MFMIRLCGLIFCVLALAPAATAQLLGWKGQWIPIYSENFETGARSGIFLDGAPIVTDPAMVLSGKASLHLNGPARVSTDPAVWRLQPNTNYIVELRYRVLSPGNDTDFLFVSLHPPESRDMQTSIYLPSLFRNAVSVGTFSSGAQTNDSASYVLDIAAGRAVSIVIDDVVIYRLEPTPTSAPASRSILESLPFPRLGAWNFGNPNYTASSGLGGGQPYYYSVEQVENGLAFADVIAGLALDAIGTDSIRRLRQLNPNAVIVPSQSFVDGPATTPPLPSTAVVSLPTRFWRGVADAWYVKNSEGKDVQGTDAPHFLREMNLTRYSPVVGGETYADYVVDWFTRTVFRSGIWDGFFTDNLYARINPVLPNRRNPALIDADFNSNGLRDETPAAITDWVSAGLIDLLRKLRSIVGDTALFMGNAGWEPESTLAPHINGYAIECINMAWEPPGSTSKSEAGWRRAFDAYRVVQATTRRPSTNIVNGCGGTYAGYSGPFLTPTPADIARQRLVLGTTLLDDGFYYYTLCCASSAPYWFDEMSVNEKGVAVQDRQHKGYLGAPLSSATELAPGGPTILREDFDSGSLPSNLSASGAVSVTNSVDEVIAGSGSLVLHNPDHSKVGIVSVRTRAGALQLNAGKTYLVRLDWRIFETLDDEFRVSVCASGVPCDQSRAVGIVAGNSGAINMPLTVAAPATASVLELGIYNGGGKIAIDNLQVIEDGAGPWRRDFENGFVLVNPLKKSHTFTRADLAGILNRTGVRRIRGTQAPGVNSGAAVTDSLTLDPFDAIVLLADRIDAPREPVTSLPYGVSQGAVSVITDGSGADLKVGFGIVEPDAPDVAPNGLAIFGYTQNGVLVSEAGVSASSPVRSGRIYAEVAGSVNTGIAIANPNAEPATLSFFFTDSNGNNFGSGTTVAPARGKLTGFLNEAPFSATANLSGTFTFTSTVPVGVIALRGLINERGEYLRTTLPVSPIAVTDGAIVFPHFADGGGWTTRVVLVNPSDQVQNGALQFMGKGTATASPVPVSVSVNGQTGSTFNYSLPPRSSRVFRTSGSPLVNQSGSVNVTPSSGSRSPDGVVIFSYNRGGVTVSEAGVAASRANTAFRMYAEMSEDRLIQTGVAVVNASAAAMTLRVELNTLAGTSFGPVGTIRLVAGAQFAGFLNQIPGFENTAGPFRGVLRISSDAPFAVTGLRGRYNSRADFLITTTPALDETVPPSSSAIIPHLAFGSGYSTQMILMNAASSRISRGTVQLVSETGTPLGIVIR